MWLNDESLHKILGETTEQEKKLIFFVQAVLLQVPTAWFDKCVWQNVCLLHRCARSHLWERFFSFPFFFFLLFCASCKKCKTEMLLQKPPDCHNERDRHTQRPSTLPQLGYLKVPFLKEMCWYVTDAYRVLSERQDMFFLFSFKI